MTDFVKFLKKSSNNLDKFRDAVEKEESKSFQKDENYWQPTVDKAGNGYAVIRFLPTPPQDGDDGLPWCKYFSHGFQGPTGLWYIENSLTTIGKDDPVSDYNSKLWATGLDDNKKIAREQKRKLTYVSNIYVVSDPKNPDAEGKVFKFRYGKKIFAKLDEAMNPKKYDEFTKQQPIDPFDVINGANFELKIRKVDGYRNYDKSSFEESTPLLGGDPKKLEAVWNSEHSLKEIVSSDKFKDYATLKQHLDRVLGIDSAIQKKSVDVDYSDETNPITARTAENITLAGSDEDDDMFENLAEPK